MSFSRRVLHTPYSLSCAWKINVISLQGARTHRHTTARNNDLDGPLAPATLGDAAR